MDSKEKLSAALLAHNPPLTEMAEKAKEGYYSDFDSPLPMPITQLVLDLEAAGATDLANQARNGEFDATEEEGDAWFEREGAGLFVDIMKEIMEGKDAPKG
jgi:hypothetical protein